MEKNKILIFIGCLDQYSNRLIYINRIKQIKSWRNNNCTLYLIYIQFNLSKEMFI